MALLFVGGVMNVLWIALLALLVLLEKLTPVGRWIARAAGIACVAAGTWLLVSFAVMSDTAKAAAATRANARPGDQTGRISGRASGIRYRQQCGKKIVKMFFINDL